MKKELTPYFDEFRDNLSLAPYQEESRGQQSAFDLMLNNSPEKIISTLKAELTRQQELIKRMAYYSEKIRNLDS
jgi:hypothetical protein